MECINIEVSIKRIQRPLDQGIVAGIVNPCNPREVIKPIIVIYADEYPLGESFEFGVIIDKYLEFTIPSYTIFEAVLYQAKIVRREPIVFLLKNVFKAKKFFLSKWNIIDLYEPINIIHQYPLKEFLLNRKYLRECRVDIYCTGLKNYLSRVPEGAEILIKTKIGVKRTGDIA